MKITFLQNGVSPDFGPFKIGETKDIDPRHERTLIARGVGCLSSSKEATKTKNKIKNEKEVTEDGGK